MVRKFSLLLMFGALCCCYGAADSISFAVPVEWRMYSSDGPVNAFAVQNDAVWMATDNHVLSVMKRQNRIDTYQQMDGITAVGVTSMATDASGRVWIGGPQGVAVRDGGFTAYTQENGLPSSSVLSVAAAASGDVWVGTENGTARFRNGAWTSFTTEDGLAGNRVQAIAVDRSGEVWFGTNRGISKYNGTAWTTYNMNNGLSWNNTKALGIDRTTGFVWAAVGDEDVNSFNGEEWRIFMQIEPGINSIMVCTRSRVWFGTEKGLLRFNGEQWVDDPESFGFPISRIGDTFLDAEGNFWFGMEEGVMHHDNPYPPQ